MAFLLSFQGSKLNSQVGSLSKKIKIAGIISMILAVVILIIGIISPISVVICTIVALILGGVGMFAVLKDKQKKETLVS